MRSLHIGVNAVDCAAYHGWRGELQACESDAAAMAQIAAGAGIDERLVLHTAAATHARVTAELRCAARLLRADDYLLVTFAGHGASFDDLPVCGQYDETDGRDEAWCLYDAYMLDDELHALLCQFSPGVRVCVVSDSCFSGTVTRGVATGLPVSLAAPVAAGPRSLSPELRERRLDAALSNALYHRDFVATYQPRRIETSVFRGTEAHAHIVLLAACQDDQTAAESAEHGIFTDALLTIWKDGEFVGTHREFIQRIAQETGERQRPDLYCTGAPNDAFVNSRPFKPDAIAQEIPSSEPLGSELPGGTPCRSR